VRALLIVAVAMLLPLTLVAAMLLPLTLVVAMLLPLMVLGPKRSQFARTALHANLQTILKKAHQHSKLKFKNNSDPQLPDLSQT
jgi:hypothetical protein